MKVGHSQTPVTISKKWGLLCCQDSSQPWHPSRQPLGASACLGSWSDRATTSRSVTSAGAVCCYCAALHDNLTCNPAGCRQPEPLGSTGGASEVYHLYSSEIRIVYHLYTIRSPWEDLSLRRMASTPPGLELPTFGFMSRRSAIGLQRPVKFK